jgi:hypothetical protein
MMELAIPMSNAVGKVTLRIRVKGVRIASLRIKAGTLLLRLAAWVIGTQLEINMGGEFDELPPLHGRRTYEMIAGVEVPRQLSIREGSPLFVSNFHEYGQRFDIYLDGIKQNQVVSYDIDGGFVRLNRLDEKGIPFVADDEIATEVRRGFVEIRPREAI